MRTLIYVSFLLLLGLNKLSYAENQNFIVQKGIELYDEEKYDEAIREFLKVHENDSAYIYALSEMALTYIAKGKYDSVILICKRALSENSSHKSHLMGSLATAYDELGERQKAISVYQKAIKMAPYQYLNHFNIGVTYIRTQEYKKAILSFQEALRCNPFHASSHLHLGLLSARQNQLTRAVLSLETFLLLEPNSNRSNKNLVYLENIAQSYVDTSHGHMIEPIFDNLLLADMDHLIASRLVVNSNFEPCIDFSVAIVKQTEMLLEKLPFQTNEKDFWTEMYFPFFKAVKEKDQVVSLLHTMLRSVGNEDLQKWDKKNKKRLKEFYALGSELSKIKFYRHIELYGKEEKIAVNYDDGKIVSLGNRDLEEKRTGKWTFYASNGILQSEGAYKADEKLGDWMYYNSYGSLDYKEHYVDGKVQGIAKKYHPNGKLSYSLNYKDHQANGTIDIRFLTGEISEIQTYKDGVQNGPCASFFATGDTLAVFALKDGKIHGNYRNYYYNGQLKILTTYNNGKRDGNYTMYHQNGTLESKGIINDGISDGKWLSYYDNGQIKRINFYKDSVLVGKDIEYHRNGTLETENNYNEKGNLHGLSKYYDQDGYNYRCEEFNDGISTKLISYDRNGNVIKEMGSEDSNYSFVAYDLDGRKNSEGSFKKGKRDSVWTFYRKNGNVKERVHYQNGLLHGTREVYFINGQLKNKSHYENGNEEGLYQSYFIDGTSSVTGMMKNNTLVNYWIFNKRNGEISLKKYFVNGEENGWQTYYAKDQQIYRRSKYNLGDELETVFFNHTGDTLCSINFLEDSLFEIKSNDGRTLVKVGIANFLFQDTLYRYSPDGKVLSRVFYHDGEEEGILKSLSFEDNQWSQIPFLKGKKHGEELEWFENGVCKDSATYVDGDIESANILRYENGKIRKNLQYKEGMLDGACAHYGPLGEKQICLNYLGGELISYQSASETSDGWDHKQMIKTGNELISVKYRNGKPSFKCQLKDHLQHGATTYYDENGQIIDEANFAFGKNHGTHKNYYLNGALKSEKNYYMGRRNGISNQYFISGELKTQTEFYMGDRHGLSRSFNEEGTCVSSHLYHEDLFMNAVEVETNN